MPRLPHSLLFRARKVSPLLPLLLRTCRTLESARNELRWLREHVLSITGDKREYPREVRGLLLRLCRQRSRGVPLQYLLGTQPFGDLDILCRPGVLIPRPETEAYTSHLAELLHQDPELGENGRLKILDICTGTGCISLLLHALLSRKYPDIQVLGLDISDTALRLAHDNLQHNVQQGLLAQPALKQVAFVKADVLSDSFSPEKYTEGQPTWDIVISNPPYISKAGFGRDTNRSVRNWEPKLALVPPPVVQSGAPSASHAEDIFYHKILEIAKAGSARIVLMEVGNLEQALRVARMAFDIGAWNLVEVWRDWPDQKAGLAEVEEAGAGGHRLRILGSGHGRSVFCKT